MKIQAIGPTPREAGFRMPAEWEPHQQTWMLWPERTDNWRQNAKPAQTAFLNVILAIAQFEPVSVGVSARQYDNLANQLSTIPTTHPIRPIEMSTNDAWCRDTGPTFVVNDQGEIRGVDWEFNAWGGHNGGLYYPWDLDDQVANKILAIERVHRYRTEGFVLEGGSIHVDGEGTLLTTEECLLNPNRNPHLDRESIERYLNDYLNVRKILWLPRGIVEDETDGHVDNIACFVKPGEILLAWTNDENDPQYPRCQEALDYLQSSRDAVGRKLKVERLPLPDPIITTAKDCEDIVTSEHVVSRCPGMRLAASYVNFYLCNGGLILPTFGQEKDQQAAKVLQELFPDRRVAPVPGREILLGGGNVHCITQQQPQPAKK